MSGLGFEFANPTKEYGDFKAYLILELLSASSCYLGINKYTFLCELIKITI